MQVGQQLKKAWVDEEFYLCHSSNCDTDFNLPVDLRKVNGLTNYFMVACKFFSHTCVLSNEKFYTNVTVRCIQFSLKLPQQPGLTHARYVQYALIYNRSTITTMHHLLES